MWPNPQFTADLVTFTEGFLYRKLHFLCSIVEYFLQPWHIYCCCLSACFYKLSLFWWSTYLIIEEAFKKLSTILSHMKLFQLKWIFRNECAKASSSIKCCVKSVRIPNCSGPHFATFGLNTDQNNSEYGHFLRSKNFVLHSLCL